MINFVNRNKNIILKILFLVALLFALLYLFRGSYQYGLNMDEITRANNLVAFFNPEAYPQNQGLYTIDIFGYNIPLMQREYISTAMLLPYLPLFLFDNYLIGIRTIYFIYFFLSLSVFFLTISKFNTKIALITTTMVASSPIFYPAITIGFAWTIHLLLMTPAIYLLYQYFTKHYQSNKYGYLFMGILLLTLAVNISFYNIWILTALFLTSLLFFSKQWMIIITSWKKILVVLTAFWLGLFNFVIYNIDNKLATFKPLFQRFFDADNYNKNPVNYVEAIPFFDDLIKKFRILLGYLVEPNYLSYLALTLLIIILYLIICYKLIYLKRLSENKYYFISIITTILILIFIFISPNTYRAGHYVHLIPFFSLSVVSLFLLYQKIFPKSILYWKVLLILIIFLNISSSTQAMNEANKTNGTGYFSPAIFELNDYYKGSNISDRDTIYLQWGMYSQIYFLNKGKYLINSQVFQLVNKSNEEQKDILKKYLINFTSQSDSLYFPIYDQYNELWDPNAKAFFDLMNDYHYEYEIEQKFLEKNSDEIFTLYRVDNCQKLQELLKST